ncbi:DUF2334 domain-containing protein [Lysinibacillus sp. FSL K6-0232]|uniref:DUF2334 domain-containing protein n=1 Tax=Lysinibacillus sp. FSL K6-0232 TaxID=2921425 RepID=UPI0030F8972E
MRSNYCLWLIMGWLCFYTWHIDHTVYAADAQKDVALIYVTSNKQPNEDVQAVQQILQAYTSVDTIALEDIYPHSLQRYERIVVINTYSTVLPAKALDALNQFQGPALMIGDNALQLAPFAQWQEGPVVELRALGAESLNKPVQWESVQPTANAKIIKMASAINQSYPFIIQQQNWSFIGAFINEGTLQYNWPALLGELLQLPKPQAHQAFIVLSDITMKTNVQKLKKVVDAFAEHNIPVALEVTPIIVEEQVNYLHDNKTLLRYLQQLQKEGYTFILSAATSMEQSLEYLALRNIYPTMGTDNSALFTSSIQQGNQSLYSAQLDNHIIYPLTAGTVMDSAMYPFYPVKQQIDLLLKAPGSVIGMQYPAYSDAAYVQELADYLTNHPQIKLINFRQTKQQVKSENITIVQHENGEQMVHLSLTNFQRLKILWNERPFESILWALVLIVSLFVALFFMNTLRLRITLRKRLFEERKTNG